MSTEVFVERELSNLSEKCSSYMMNYLSKLQLRMNTETVTDHLI